jgi:CRISPR-associated protein Cas1
MEEFRPMTVDLAVWRCISARQVRPGTVHARTRAGFADGCRCAETFLAAYERRMLTLMTHPGSGRRVSFRVALTLQAKALAMAIMDSARAVSRPAVEVSCR